MFQNNNWSHFFNIDYINENESLASTNKDSNTTSSYKGNNFYNFFRNKNNIKKKYEYEFDEKENKPQSNIKIQSYMSHIINKTKNKENNKSISRTKNDYYPKALSNYNNYKKPSIHKNVLIKKTMNVLNLKKGTINQNVSKFEISNYLSSKQNKKNKRKAPEKKMLNDKVNRTQPIKLHKQFTISKTKDLQKDNKKNSNNVMINNNKFDLGNEKKKIELIKKQYIKNIKNSHILFHDIKEKMNNITHYQNNILDLNNKSLKYSALSQEDNLKKYKEENIKNLKNYQLKKEQIKRRPFSCEDKKEKGKKARKFRKKILSAEMKDRREKREKEINDKIGKIKNYNIIKNKCYNSLRFYNELLDINKDKKQNFYNYLKQKLNNNKVKQKYLSQNASAKIKI